MSPSKWKEEQYAIISLARWGLVVYGDFKFFTRRKNYQNEEGSKKDKTEEKVNPLN